MDKPAFKQSCHLFRIRQWGDKVKKFGILCIVSLFACLYSCALTTSELAYPSIEQLVYDVDAFATPPSYGSYQNGSFHSTVYPYNEYSLSLRNVDLNQYDKISIYHYSRYFSLDTYQIYTIDQIDSSARFYIDIPIVEGIHRAMFMQYDPDWYPPGGAFPSLWIETIESNGVYSYVLNLKAHDFPGSIFAYQVDLLNVIFHDDAFPYTVYLDEEMIFFMSKDASFEKDYLFGFVKNPQMYLFKP